MKTKTFWSLVDSCWCSIKLGLTRVLSFWNIRFICLLCINAILIYNIRLWNKYWTGSKIYICPYNTSGFNDYYCQALCPLSTLFSVYVNLMFHSSLCQISFYESYSGLQLFRSGLKVKSQMSDIIDSKLSLFLVSKRFFISVHV